jgi:hypothetical protein
MSERTDVTRWRSGSHNWGVDRYGWGWGWWAEDTATKRGTRSGSTTRREAIVRAEACARSLGADMGAKVLEPSDDR